MTGTVTKVGSLFPEAVLVFYPGNQKRRINPSFFTFFTNTTGPDLNDKKKRPDSSKPE